MNKGYDPAMYTKQKQNNQTQKQNRTQQNTEESNWDIASYLLSFRVSMATGFGEARWPEMGIRLLLSEG